MILSLFAFLIVFFLAAIFKGGTYITAFAVLFSLVIGIVIGKVGYYYYLKGLGYSPSTASRVAIEIGGRGRSVDLGKAKKYPKFINPADKRRGVILMISGVTISALTFFVIFYF